MTLTRSTPMRRTKPEAGIRTSGFNRTRCPQCKAKLEAGQRIHPDCIDGYAEAQAAKAEREEVKRALAAAKVERADLRRRKEQNRPLSWHQKKAQAAVNAYVRARDAHLPCISCRRSDKNSWDAGHYRSRGAAVSLALDPKNIHRQCVQCNQHLHGNHIEFRIGLIARYGIEYVEALECDQSTKKYTADELDGIAAHYRAELRALLAAQSA